jgi:NAD(P) transhydrogenase subunit alpha
MSTRSDILNKISELTEELNTLTHNVSNLGTDIALMAGAEGSMGATNPFVMSLTVFALACFVGYYVVWKVTPALHSPLMGVTNAISSVIIVGALIAAGPSDGNTTSILFGFIAVVLASVNIFGGFIVTQRMLQMFKKKVK